MPDAVVSIATASASRYAAFTPSPITVGYRPSGVKESRKSIKETAVQSSLDKATWQFSEARSFGSGFAQ